MFLKPALAPGIDFETTGLENWMAKPDGTSPTKNWILLDTTKSVRNEAAWHLNTLKFNWEDLIVSPYCFLILVHLHIGLRYSKWRWDERVLQSEPEKWLLPPSLRSCCSVFQRKTAKIAESSHIIHMYQILVYTDIVVCITIYFLQKSNAHLYWFTACTLGTAICVKL